MERIVLEEYCEQWPRIAADEIRVVSKVLPQAAFHHIGSTSIPGCKAKPIIDILGIVSSFNILLGKKRDLEELGYQYQGAAGVDRREMFLSYDRRPMKFHLSFFEDGCYQVAHNLAFRDTLRNDPALMAEYVKLKERLSAEHPHDIGQYSHGKTDFIMAHGGVRSD